MGKVTGFLEYERLDEGYEPVPQRVKNWKEFVIGLNDEQAKIQSARCMDCGTPFCNSGCPVNNIIPDFNDLVYRNDWKRAIDVLHSTNNFPEFTGPGLPGAVRGGLHAERQRRSGGHQVDRARDHRPGLGRRLGPAATGGAEDRQVGGRGRQRTGWPGSGATAGARRTCGDGVREEQPHRRAAALRHPRLQDGEEPHRPAHRADACGGRGLPHRRAGRRAARRQQGDQRRQGHAHARAASRRVRCGAADRRRRTEPRPAGARPRTLRACTSRWSSCRCRTRSSPATRSRARSWPPASTWWSSAAAIPAATASAPAIAMARPASRSSS